MTGTSGKNRDKYCGVFSCKHYDCEYHIINGDDFSTPKNFDNMSNSEYCKERRKHIAEETS